MVIKDKIDELKSTGFTSFNLKDFDTSLYNLLWEEIGDGPHLLKNYINHIRTKWVEDKSNDLDMWGITQAPYDVDDFRHLNHWNEGIRRIELCSNFGSFEKVKSILENIQNRLNNINQNTIVDYHELQQCFSFYVGCPEEIQKSVYGTFKEIIKVFYRKVIEPTDIQFEFVWYPKDGLIYSHRDMWIGSLPDPKKQCCILLYFDKEYDESKGGQLYVDYDLHSVLPKIGEIAILDYDKFALEHRVEPPTTEYGRYGILSFIDRDILKNIPSLI